MPNLPDLPVGEPLWVETAPGDAGVTVETAPRHMKFVRVAVDELEDLKSSNSTLELAFFGISFGALLTLGTTLSTVTLDGNVKVVFVVLTVVFVLASAYFGLATWRGERRWRGRIERLKQKPSS